MLVEVLAKSLLILIYSVCVQRRRTKVHLTHGYRFCTKMSTRIEVFVHIDLISYFFFLSFILSRLLNNKNVIFRILSHFFSFEEKNINNKFCCKRGTPFYLLLILAYIFFSSCHNSIRSSCRHFTPTVQIDMKWLVSKPF